jgi:hypothetical protein
MPVDRKGRATGEIRITSREIRIGEQLSEDLLRNTQVTGNFLQKELEFGRY